jgi:hypothetical protein
MWLTLEDEWKETNNPAETKYAETIYTIRENGSQT